MIHWVIKGIRREIRESNQKSGFGPPPKRLIKHKENEAKPKDSKEDGFQRDWNLRYKLRFWWFRGREREKDGGQKRSSHILIYIVRVYMCALLTVRTASVERFTRFDWKKPYTHLVKRKNHWVKAAERDTTKARSNGQSVLWKRFNEKNSRAIRCFHIKVVVLYLEIKHYGV